MERTTTALRAWFAVLLVSASVRGFDVPTSSDDFTLEVSPLIQPRVQVDFDGPAGTAAPEGHSNFDVYIQRARLLVHGTAYKQFAFGINIVSLRIGQRGNLNVAPFLQDVRVAWVPANDVNLEMGLLIMPLSHAAVEAAGYQSGIEGAGSILLYNNARNLRETGVQFRALFLDRRLLVRGGVYEGARNTNPAPTPPLNPDGMPLVGGMVRLNLVGDEPGYVYPSIYLDGKTRISVGVGGQYQPHSGGLPARGTVYDAYRALATDLFADVALPADSEALLAVGGYRFDYGAGNGKTGYGMHGEVGYRWGFLEPQGNFYWFNSDTKKNSFLKIAGGLNLFLRGHNAKLQAEFASAITNANLRETPALHQIVVQTQLLF